MIEIRFARFSFSTNLDCCNFSDYLDQFTLYLLDFCPRVYEGELLIFALLRDNKFLTSLISPGSQIKRTPKFLVLKVYLTLTARHADVGRKEDVQVSHISAAQRRSSGSEFSQRC